MATKKSSVETELLFASKDKNLLVDQGKLEDEKSRNFTKSALGIKKKIVEATRHSILSGPPGVGKTYGTMDECKKAGIKYITIAPGMTDLQLAIKLAIGVAELNDNEDLAVILDDADDVVFGTYETLNKWKLAMGDIDHDLGIIPHYHYPASMIQTIASLTKQKRMKIVETIQKWQSESDIGLSIPMDRVRFIVLCNLDLENPKAFSSPKIRSAVAPVLDRFNYKRMSMPWEHQWGWLAYTLKNTQPFPDYPLTVEQKRLLLDWMYSNWEKLRSSSYRTVKKLAADMINETEYEDAWKENLKGH